MYSSIRDHLTPPPSSSSEKAKLSPPARPAPLVRRALAAADRLEPSAQPPARAESRRRERPAAKSGASPAVDARAVDARAEARRAVARRDVAIGARAALLGAGLGALMYGAAALVRALRPVLRIDAWWPPRIRAR